MIYLLHQNDKFNVIRKRLEDINIQNIYISFPENKLSFENNSRNCGLIILFSAKNYIYFEEI